MPPSSLTPPRLDEFLARAATIVGNGNISRDPSTGAPEGIRGSRRYGDPFPLGDGHTASAAVRPETVREVRDIVRAANELRISLWTVSCGKNLGYGGSAPVVSGSVVLDLHRMTKIIEINEEYAYAIVEPGVTFQALYDEIQRRGLRLWLSVPALGWGSVLGNTLDRGIGYTPEAIHYKNQSGMEVVLPNSDLLRTGMGSVEGSEVWPLYPGGFGPGLDGLFYQSNYGIVTKLGIHLSHAPEGYTRIQVDVPTEPDLAPLVGALTELLRRRIIHNPPSLFDQLSLLTSRVPTDREDPEVARALGPYSTMEKYIPDDLVDALSKRLNLPAWRAIFALYGPPEVNAALVGTIRNRLQRVGGAKLTTESFSAPPGSHLRSSDVPRDFMPQSGVPGLEVLDAFTSTPDGIWHNCYAPVLPPSGRELCEWWAEAKKIRTKHAINFTADFHVFDRYVIAIHLILFHPSASHRLQDLQLDLMRLAKKYAVLEYRTHVCFMNQTAAHQNFNDGAFGRFTTLLKDAIDPNGVLSPGKSGIWNSGMPRGDGPQEHL